MCHGVMSSDVMTMVQVGGLSRNTSYWLVMSCTDTAGTILNSSLLRFTTGQCSYLASCV